MSENKLTRIKELTVNWRDGKCFHCGNQLDNFDDGVRCPVCTWVDSRVNNANYLLDIGKEVGTIFFMTGSAK